jgi:hypothetical protein
MNLPLLPRNNNILLLQHTVQCDMERAGRGKVNLKPKLYESLVIFDFLIHIQPIQLGHTDGCWQKHQHYNKK